MAKQGDIIVGLDIGTTKVCAVVGEIGADGVDVTGVGEARSKGLRKGVVVNIDSTMASIAEAVERAGAMAGVEVASVFAGLAGSHVQGLNSHGIVSVANHEVTREDVFRVLEQARHISLPLDRQVIHALPQDYIVDHQDGVREPVGMSGMRLEARVHLVTAAAASVQNVIKCAERCKLHVTELVLEPLASAEAVLSEDEKEIGVVLIDIGGGTTDVVIYVDGSLVHTTVIPLGGLNVTSDVATLLRAPLAEAERIKIRHGCAMVAMVDEHETIEVSGVGGRDSRTIQRHELVSIIESRMDEIFQLVRRVLTESGYMELLGAGVVITGGATLLQGTHDLASCVLNLPVRAGLPMGVGGLSEMVNSPAHATAVGLLKYGAKQPERVVSYSPTPAGTSALPKTAQARGTGAPAVAEASPAKKMFGGFLEWCREVF